MQYKGLIAKHHYAIDAKVFVGEIVNVPNSLDVIAFSAETLTKLREVMIDAIDQYLADCHMSQRQARKIHEEASVL